MTTSRSDALLLPLPTAGPTDVVVPAAKTRRPRQRVSALQRHLLVERWCRTEGDVTLVLAPPGFGKTTFVSQVADAVVDRVVWVTVEPTDDDPVVLISTLLAAINRAGVEVTMPAGVLTGDEPTFSRRVLPQFRASLEQLDETLLLVVDDVHWLESSSSVAVLAAMVDGLPEGSRAVLVGRTRPDLPVARWRSEGRVSEFGSDDLRFDPPDTRACLAGLLGRRPTPEEAEVVQSTSAGWPVAVYLEGSAIARSGRAQTALSRGLEEYLRAEVMSGLDPQLADFLSRTAVLASLSGPLCDAVLDRTESAQVLRQVEQSTLLVTRLDGPGGWYRVHPLLREALVARLGEDRPAEVRRLHARAAHWFAGRNESEEAMWHAVRSGDAALVEEVGWRYGIETLMLGRSTTMQGWLDRLPATEVESNAGLAVLAAWTGVVAGDSVTAERWSLAAARALGPRWTEHLGRSHREPLLALLHCLNGEVPAAEAAALAGATVDLLAVTDRLRPMALLIHGWTLVLAGQVEAGAGVLADSGAHARSIGVGTTSVEAPALLGYVHASRGEVEPARSMAALALKAWTDHDLEDSAATTGLLWGLETFLFVRQRSAERTRAGLSRTDPLVSDLYRVIPAPAALVAAYVARTWAILGDLERARAALARATELERRLTSSAWLSGVIAESRAEVARLGPTAELSDAQRRVLVELATDKTMGEIAADLYLSINTVKSHARDIYRKLGITTRREARRIVAGE